MSVFLFASLFASISRLAEGLTGQHPGGLEVRVAIRVLGHQLVALKAAEVDLAVARNAATAFERVETVARTWSGRTGLTVYERIAGLAAEAVGRLDAHRHSLLAS